MCPKIPGLCSQRERSLSSTKYWSASSVGRNWSSIRRSPPSESSSVSIDSRSPWPRYCAVNQEIATSDSIVSHVRRPSPTPLHPCYPCHPWFIPQSSIGLTNLERRSQDHIRRELYQETIWQWHPLTHVSPVESAVERNNLNHQSTTRNETRCRKTQIVKHGKSSQTGMMYSDSSQPRVEMHDYRWCVGEKL
jgi:hypothetical protein